MAKLIANKFETWKVDVAVLLRASGSKQIRGRRSKSRSCVDGCQNGEE